MSRWITSRSDGRSDRQIVYELVELAEPESLFKYTALLDVLSEGLEKPATQQQVYAAVSSANRLLLAERTRYLSVVRGVGYRMIRAEEHLPVAVRRKRRAELQIERGVEILRGARLDELTPAQRQLHEGQLMVMSGLVEAVKYAEAERERTDMVIGVILDEQKKAKSERDEIKKRLDDG